MGMAWRHSGGSLPITLGLDEVETTVRCPICARLEQDGTVTIRAEQSRPSGTTPATCPHGHMTIVTWSRRDA